MPASAPFWADLPEECRLRVLSFLDIDDRLRCRLAVRWWAEASLTSLNVHVWDTDLEADAVAESVSLLLGRPGLCASLEAVRLSFESPDLSCGQFTALLMLLARVAPKLRWLSLLDPTPSMDARTLTACARAFGQLVRLQHLRISPPSGNLAFLPLLPHLRTLHLASSEDGDLVFRPSHPLTALRTLILGGPTRVSWQHLPNLSYLDVVGSPDEPLLLAPVASSLRTLLLWDSSPSCIVPPAALPRLEALVCSADMLLHLPSLPSVTALKLELPLLLPQPAVDKINSLPTLQSLHFNVDEYDAFDADDLNSATALQRHLPRFSLCFEPVDFGIDFGTAPSPLQLESPYSL